MKSLKGVFMFFNACMVMLTNLGNCIFRVFSRSKPLSPALPPLTGEGSKHIVLFPSLVNGGGTKGGGSEIGRPSRATQLLFQPTAAYLYVIVLTLAFVTANIFAATSVKVLSKDEAMGETNISKPRIYIENTGTTTLTYFDFYYKLTTENYLTPFLEVYYAPGIEVSLLPSGGDYFVKYHVTGANLAPGKKFPDADGCIVGLHYNNWGPWDKTNDYSYKPTPTFVENNHISVYIDGTLIYGETVGTAEGSLTREVWNSISGTLVSLIPVNTPFNSTQTLSSFEETNPGENYGSRIRGYITAPVSGTYYFWIAGDDNSELWLSTNNRPENKVKIANVPYYTNPRQWNKYTSQQSAAISLTAGQKYYVETLHKQGSGGDNLAVGWLKPGQTGDPVVITGDVLTPFVYPDAVPSLTATLVSPTQINLTWTDYCTNEDGYRVERSVAGGAYSQLADLGPNATSYQNTGLTAGTVYSYRVRAFNSQGYSGWSNVFMLTTQESTAGAVILEKWTGLSVDGEIASIPVNQISNTTAILTSLEEPSYNEDNYGTRIRGYITAPSTGAYTFWIRGDDDCEFYLSTSTSPASAAKICNVDGWTTTSEWNKYTSQKSAVKNLVAGQKYYFQILHKEGTAYNSMAVGWLKPGESGTIPSQVIPGSVLSKFIEPAAPSNLSATAVSGSQINLVWSDNSDNEENFIIEQSLDGITFSQIASKGPNSASAAITGLMPVTTYTFRVKAINSKGSSAWSATTAAKTQQTTAGAISRQVWQGINAGAGVAGIPVATTPSDEGSLPQLQEPPSADNNFGTRVRGYLTAPSTGNYTFWVSGDDDCELWLSTSEDPAAKVKIAYFTTWTDQLQYGKFSTQKSSPVALTAGSRYYIEVLHIDNIGADHMAVQWSKPGESTTIPTEIVPGSVLSMFVIPATPTGLAATTVSSSQIDLSWTDNADNETGYVIERALLGQSFSTVATLGAGVTSYASTGLLANSQYQYRVQAVNYAGNSAYTNTVTKSTAQSGNQGGPDLTPQLLSFALYSQNLSVVNQRSIFTGGGAVGSNTLVKVDIEAKIAGDIVCGGNVEVLDRAEIDGDVTCGGTFTADQAAPPIIGGNIYENASVTNVDIPSKSAIPYGTTDFPVDFNEIKPISPGSYKDLKVPRDAVLTFSAGIYNFRSLTIENNGTILFDVPMDKTIDINVETNLELQDRATAKFVDKGYAPCVKLYTNAYAIRIGTDIDLAGILTAPHAAISICSRTKIEGAVYAKSISLEPDAIFMSSFVNPDDDFDGDCVPNLTEMMLNDKPDDGEDFTLVAIPTPALIDNTDDNTVNYSFGCKYPFITCTWDITYPAGSLTNASIAPAYKITNKPPTGVPEFNIDGYQPIGNYMSIAANTLKPNQPLRIALPLFSGVMPAASYHIAWYNTETSEWNTTAASPFQSCALLSNSTVSDVTTMIIVQDGDASTITYLNDGMVYSTETKAKVLFEGQIDARSATNPAADADYVTISYLEHTSGNPAGVPGTVPIPIVNQGNSGILTMSKEATFSNKITIKSILINSTNFFPAFTYTADFVVNPGQVISFKIDRTVDEMISSKFSGDKISAFYSVNSQSFESMSFSEGVIKGGVGSWNYQFYLKDHLGSTRMALTDDDKIASATMYQPYGTMADVEDIGAGVSNPVRQRFTTKEFDEDGDVNSAPGIGLFYFGKRYFDADLGRWTSVDPKPNAFDLFNYCNNNPINDIDPNGEMPAVVIYAYLMAVMRSPDFTTDLQWIADDISQGDYAGLVGDLASLSLPNATGGGRITSKMWEVAKNISNTEFGDKVAARAFKMLKGAGAEIHHLFTNKSKVSGISAQFGDYLSGAGMSLKDAENLAPILGHKGSHGKGFWQPFLEQLKVTTDGLKKGTPEYNEAVTKVLESAGKQAVDKFTK
ncbi:MAG TPA: PA14 domain-containing protein [Chitinispirillaceae bacterium]|nr:PA14 domain-containing protein [Chitinispirillaceae bacterium]